MADRQCPFIVALSIGIRIWTLERDGERPFQTMPCAEKRGNEARFERIRQSGNAIFQLDRPILPHSPAACAQWYRVDRQSFLDSRRRRPDCAELHRRPNDAPVSSERFSTRGAMGVR